MPELDFERITLNAIPDGEMPVFHASQFETMRPFIADLKWGSEDFAPGDGCWCTLAIRKTDDTLVIIDDIELVTNTVSCILSQQAVACIGDNFCQLKVWATSEDDEDGCIACLNFILHVQPDPEANGITSESEINNLTEQIEEITQQVIGDDYYTKVQTDALLDLKADKLTTYTKSEVDTALNLKADKSTTYTKAQVDSALLLKADASNVYTKSETNTLLSAKANVSDLATVATTGDYDDLINKPSIPAAQVQSDYAQADNTQVDYIKNKPDIDAMIADALLAVMPVDTASGPIATFDTELAAPLVNVSSNIVATGGNGTPDNPNPINGYTEANITTNGDVITISFGQTVYDGTLDVTRGKLTVTYVGVVYDGSNDENWGLQSINSYNIANFYIKLDKEWTNAELSLCDRFPIQSTLIANTTTEGYLLSVPDTLFLRINSSRASTTAELKNWLASNNVKLVYKISTPFDIDLTPEVISAVVGTNNVFSDTNGDTTVQFKDSIQHYIDTRV